MQESIYFHAKITLVFYPLRINCEAARKKRCMIGKRALSIDELYKYPAMYIIASAIETERFLVDAGWAVRHPGRAEPSDLFYFRNRFSGVVLIIFGVVLFFKCWQG